MDKEQKKKLKILYKEKEQKQLLESIPLSIEVLKDLLRYLNRESAPNCDHSLKETNSYLEKHNIDASIVVPWLGEHGGFCDCEVIFNVYNDVGDIVGWHLD